MHFFLLGQIEITFVFDFEIKPYRDTLEVRLNNLNRTYLCRLSTLVLKAQPYLFLFIPIRGLFYPSVLLLELCSALKTFLEPSNVGYQFLFWKYRPIILFFIRPNFGPFCTFLALRGYFWGLGQVQKKVLEPTNVGYQFLFWKYSPIFLFLIRPNFGLFCTFWALRGVFFLVRGGHFRGQGQVQKYFWNLLM